MRKFIIVANKIFKNEYQLQLIVLSQNESIKFMVPIKKLIKRSLKLRKSTPDVVFYDKDILNVKDLYNLQLEHHSKSLLYKLNNRTHLGLSTKIRVKDISEYFWIEGCIFENKFSKNNYKFFEIQIIKLLQEKNLSICNHTIYDQFHHINKQGHWDLEQILGREIIEKNLNSIRKTGIKYLDEIIVNGILMTWATSV